MTIRCAWRVVAVWFGSITLMALLASAQASDAPSQADMFSTPPKDANPVILKAEPATKVDLLEMKGELKDSIKSTERWIFGGLLTVAIAIFIQMAQIFRRLGALEQLHKNGSPAPHPAGNLPQVHDQKDAAILINGPERESGHE